MLLRFCFCFVCLREGLMQLKLDLKVLIPQPLSPSAEVIGINTKYSSQPKENKNVHSGAYGWPQTRYRAKAAWP